ISVSLHFAPSCLPCRDHANVRATPRIDDNEKSRESVAADCDESFFLIRVIITNRDSLVVVENGDRISKINAGFSVVVTQLDFVPFKSHRLDYMYICMHNSRNLSRGAAEARRRPLLF